MKRICAAKSGLLAEYVTDTAVCAAAGSGRRDLKCRTRVKRTTEKFMSIIESRVDPNSETFRANREQMLALIGGFRALEQKVRDFSDSKRERFRARGQLLPRERVALLI